MFFIIKTLIAGAVVTFAAWLAGRKPILAGFIVALPLISMLSILFSYLQYRDMDKINQFAGAILLGVPLSLTFFIPFLLNKWLKMSFPLTYALAVGCLVLAYFLHGWILKTGLFR